MVGRSFQFIERWESELYDVKSELDGVHQVYNENKRRIKEEYRWNLEIVDEQYEVQRAILQREFDRQLRKLKKTSNRAKRKEDRLFAPKLQTLEIERQAATEDATAREKALQAYILEERKSISSCRIIPPEIILEIMRHYVAVCNHCKQQ
jgi:hypothetical protein